MDRAQEEASLDLGATPWANLLARHAPESKAFLIAAGMLNLYAPMDEIAVTFFLIGRDNTCLSKSGAASAAASLQKLMPSPL